MLVPPRILQHLIASCSCLSHAINLGNVDVMKLVTHIGIAENKQLMWEFDPRVPGNKVLNGKLDVIAAIRTLAVKVRSFPRILILFDNQTYLPVADPGLRSTHPGL